MKITEGYMPYLKYKTYYRIVGKCTGNKKPLLLLHGGPGSTHNYFEVLDKAAEDGRALIMYDQLGCGLSSIPSRPNLWNAETWIEELIQLRKYLNLDEVHLLGQSWGGMMAIQYACQYKPKGIKSYILASTLPSSTLWKKEQRRRIKYLPQKCRMPSQKQKNRGLFFRKIQRSRIGIHAPLLCKPGESRFPRMFKTSENCRIRILFNRMGSK